MGSKTKITNSDFNMQRLDLLVNKNFHHYHASKKSIDTLIESKKRILLELSSFKSSTR